MEIVNKKAKFNYTISETLEAGLVLSGAEAKAVRGKRVDLTNAYAKIINNELYLVGAVITTNNTEEPDYSRSRKLLVHRKELISLQSKIKAKSLTLVPISLYNTGNLFKVELGLGKSKKSFEKKEVKKRKAINREIERDLKGY